MDLIRHYFLPLALIAALFLLTFFFSLKVWGHWYDEWSGYNAEVEISDGVCNIAIVKVQGDIVSYATDDELAQYTLTVGDDLVDRINRSEWDWNVEGLLLEIDSYGGVGSAASEVADRLEILSIPSAAYIREAGTSAAYLIASGADTIIATPFSDVGSIGFTMSYLEQVQQNEDSGLSFVSLASGEYKDSGNPNRELTSEERALFERDLEVFHKALVRRIAVNRNLSVEEIEALADGSSLPAELALEKRLVDQVGNLETVRAWFAAQLETGPEDIIFCD